MLGYKIPPVAEFEKSLKKLDQSVARRVMEKLERLANDPSNVPAPMGGFPKQISGLRKVRAGDWRVFFWVDHTKKELVPYFVQHRDEGYEWLYHKK